MAYPDVLSGGTTGNQLVDIGKAIEDVKKGKIDFKVDKTGIIRERHVGVLNDKVWKDKFEKFLKEDNEDK